MRDFKKLLIWQQGMIIVDKVYDIIPYLPLEEKIWDAISKQSKRCSQSSLIKLVVDMKTACSLQLEV
jgi:hypothetical protein